MTDAGEVTQDFLDSVQYRTESILHYEHVYGEDFVSPGGGEVARELIGRFKLAPGSRVLDAGCGLGGSAFVMAREFDFCVDGIDLSRNMLELARRKLDAHGLAGKVSLEWGDCLELDCQNRYDAIYSRDVFLHVHDKKRLFAVLYSALRPGGQLLFTDYCCGARPWAPDFTEYVGDRGYDLHTPEAYRALILQAGFSQVSGEDISGRFIEILRADLERIAASDLQPQVRDKLAQGWRQKLERSLAGDHRWGLFSALK